MHAAYGDNGGNENRDIQTEKDQYFQSAFGHFGVFVVELHPLLDDTADRRVRVVDELEAGDIGTTFPQVCQVDVQETLRKGGDGQRCEPRYIRKNPPVSVREANRQPQDVFLGSYNTLKPLETVSKPPLSRLLIMFATINVIHVDEHAPFEREASDLNRSTDAERKSSFFGYSGPDRLTDSIQMFQQQHSEEFKQAVDKWCHGILHF